MRISLLPFWVLHFLFVSRGLMGSIGYWALHDFQRTCNSEGGDVCHYQFYFSEDTRASLGPRAEVRHLCTFFIESLNDRPANETDFQSAACLFSIPYRVNGGWNHNGVIVIAVTNFQEGIYAFFAYRDRDIENGKSVQYQAQPAYKVGTFVESNVIARETREEAIGRQVLNLDRSPRAPPGVLLVTFEAGDDKGWNVSYSITAQAPGGTDSVALSFRDQKYSKKEQEKPWHTFLDA